MKRQDAATVFFLGLAVFHGQWIGTILYWSLLLALAGCAGPLPKVAPVARSQAPPPVAVPAASRSAPAIHALPLPALPPRPQDTNYTGGPLSRQFPNVDPILRTTKRRN